MGKLEPIEVQQVQDVPAIMITFTHTLDEHRSMCLQTAIGSDVSEDELNKRLDLLSRASNRQRAVTRMPSIRLLLEIRRAQRATVAEKVEQAAQADRGLRTGYQSEDSAAGRRKSLITPARKLELDRVEAMLKKSQGEIVALDNEIEQYELELKDLEAKAGRPAEG